MEPICAAARREMATAGGRTDLLPSELREHLGACGACAAELEAWVPVRGILENALPPEDRALREAILRAAAGSSPLRGALPSLAASSAILAGGVGLLGGIPGLGFLPVVTAVGIHAGGAAAARWADLWLVLGTAARAAGAVIPPGWAAVSGVASLGAGLLLLRRLAAARSPAP